MVLRLLQRLSPVGFITTHFLDFGRKLERDPPVLRLEFLQVGLGDHQRSTYQFLPGVAATSLATTTAGRLGSPRRSFWLSVRNESCEAAREAPVE